MTGKFFVWLYEFKSRSVFVQEAGVVVQIHYALKQVAVKKQRVGVSILLKQGRETSDINL